MNGNVVLVTGTSGAGKTTTCRTFARRADEMYLLFGMDLLVGTLFPGQYTIFGSRMEDGLNLFHFGKSGWKALQAMHEMIAAASRSGQNLVVDHLMFVDPPVLQDCVWRLAGLPVLFVNLRVPYERIEQRLMTRHRELPETMAELVGPDGEREMAARLSALRPWFYEAAYQNHCFDLDLETSELSPEEVCERIEVRLAEGPGTAFEDLRKRYPDRPVHSSEAGNDLDVVEPAGPAAGSRSDR
jgi:chloramphenicol 3-O-phosphotransferase